MLGSASRLEAPLSVGRGAMDPALLAALLPLAPAPRLAGLEAKLVAAGVFDCRAMADLLREDSFEVVSDILGLEDAFSEAGFVLLGGLRP